MIKTLFKKTNITYAFFIFFIIVAGSIMILPETQHDQSPSTDKRMFQKYVPNWENKFLNLSNNQKTGKGVKVAVLDTEVTRANLQKHINKASNFTNSKMNSSGKQYHGDEIIYKLLSVSPNIELYHGIVAEKDGSVTKKSLMEGLQWSINQKVDIINMSISFPDEDDEMDILLKEAVSQGIILVAPTGNDGSSEISYPASSDYVIAVGAIDIEGDKYLLSNYGSEVLFGVPGVYIKTDEGDSYESYSEGTSYAAAILSGMIARIKEAHPTYNQADIVNKLKEMTGKKDRDIFLGYGVPKF